MKKKDKNLLNMENLLLKDKYCLITGATSGIGRSAALKMSNMGASITFIARNADKAKSLVEEIFKESGKKPRAIIADLSSQSEIRRASEEYLQLDQPLHILLNQNMVEKRILNQSPSPSE